MSRHDLKIKIDPLGIGLVELDGINVGKYVRATSIETAAGEPTCVHLEATAVHVELEAEAAEILANVLPGDIERETWADFIMSMGLADHLGDAAESVCAFAKAAGLPEPDGDWIEWGKERGGTAGGLYGRVLAATEEEQQP